MSRSACVPFPTPGAPTRITRAAFFSFDVAMEADMNGDRKLTNREPDDDETDKGRAPQRQDRSSQL